MNPETHHRTEADCAADELDFDDQVESELWRRSFEDPPAPEGEPADHDEGEVSYGD